MLSIEFSQAEKDGMIMALTKHHPDHATVDELIATLETAGETVMTKTEALILLDTLSGIAVGDNLYERISVVIQHYATQIGRWAEAA